MVNMSADDVVQLFTYNNVECVVMLRQVCGIWCTVRARRTWTVVLARIARLTELF